MKNKKVEGRKSPPPLGERREDEHDEPGNFAIVGPFSTTTTTTTTRPFPLLPPPRPPEETAETDESFSSSLAPIVASHMHNEDSASISPPTSSLFSSSASASSKEDEDKKRSAHSVMRKPVLLGVLRSERREDGAASGILPTSSERILRMDDLQSAQGLSMSERYSGRKTKKEEMQLLHPQISTSTIDRNKAADHHVGESGQDLVSPVRFQNTFSLSDEEAVVPKTNELLAADRGVIQGKDGQQGVRGSYQTTTTNVASTLAPEGRTAATMKQFQGPHFEELASAFDEMNDGKLSSIAGNIFLMSPDRVKPQQVVSKALEGRGDQRIQFSNPTERSNVVPLERDSRDPGSYTQAHQSSGSNSSPSSDEKQRATTLSTVKKNPQILPDIPFFKNTSLAAKILPTETSNEGVQASDPQSNKNVDFDKVLLDYENEDLAEVDMGLANLPFARLRRKIKVENESIQRVETQTEQETGENSRASAHDGEEYESPHRSSQAAKRATGQPIRTLWDERYEELRDYRVQHGHCTVPFSYSEKPLLASWVKRQRYQYKCKMRGEHSHLTDERQAMLDNLGFVWDTHVGAWDEKFSELEVFYRHNGHCQVPIRNKELNAWCKRQRRQYKQYIEAGGDLATMTADRVRRLSSIHFQWQSVRPASETGNATVVRETAIQEAPSTGSRKRKDHRRGSSPAGSWSDPSAETDSRKKHGSGP